MQRLALKVHLFMSWRLHCKEPDLVRPSGDTLWKLVAWPRLSFRGRDLFQSLVQAQDGDPGREAAGRKFFLLSI